MTYTIGDDTSSSLEMLHDMPKQQATAFKFAIIIVC